MRRPDPDLHATRRTRILEAALRVFARKGLQNATMPDIAAEAGMSAANLYHYVRSKDAILQALAEDERRETLTAIAAIERADDLVDGLIAVIEHELQRHDEAELVLGLEVAAEACRNPRIGEIFDTIDREMTDRVTQLLEQGRADGRISPGTDVRATAIVILSTLEGIFWRRGFDRTFDTAGTLVELRRMLTAYLQPAKPPPRRPTP